MFKRGFLAVVTAFLLVVGVLSSMIYLPASAASTSQMQNEINELEKKSAKLEKEIAALKKDKAEQNSIKSKLDEQMAVTQQKISACTALINSYKSEIKQFESEIAAKETEIADTKFLFRQRIRSLSMSGSTNNDLLVLLDSESFSDYLALSEVSRTISAHDKKLVNELSAAIAEINQKKSAINAKMAEQNSIKKTLANEQAKLKSQQSEVNGVIADINADQSALEKQNKTYEAQINKLEKEIKAVLAAAAQSSTKNPVFKSGRFTWPVPGFYNITSYYGYRVNPVSGVYKLHGGIDIASAGIYGKPIVAAADGVVISAGYNTGGFGYWVVINHGTSGGKQFATLYAHMCRGPSVSNGQTVKAGQTIGYVGSTGNSNGNHLHFEVRVNGDRVNPMGYFSKAS
jgi:murein DD-endopeptidase MepM/ murein hydrolase activator NlpD